MGHLVNPVGFRVGWTSSWSDTWYSDLSFYPELLYDVLLLRMYVLFILKSNKFEKLGWVFSHCEFVLKCNFLYANLYIYNGAGFFNDYFLKSFRNGSFFYKPLRLRNIRFHLKWFSKNLWRSHLVNSQSKNRFIRYMHAIENFFVRYFIKSRPRIFRFFFLLSFIFNCFGPFLSRKELSLKLFSKKFRYRSKRDPFRYISFKRLSHKVLSASSTSRKKKKRGLKKNRRLKSTMFLKSFVREQKVRNLRNKRFFRLRFKYLYKLRKKRRKTAVIFPFKPYRNVISKLKSRFLRVDDSVFFDESLESNFFFSKLRKNLSFNFDTDNFFRTFVSSGNFFPYSDLKSKSDLDFIFQLDIAKMGVLNKKFFSLNSLFKQLSHNYLVFHRLLFKWHFDVPKLIQITISYLYYVRNLFAFYTKSFRRMLSFVFLFPFKRKSFYNKLNVSLRNKIFHLQSLFLRRFRKAFFYVSRAKVLKRLRTSNQMLAMSRQFLLTHRYVFSEIFSKDNFKISISSVFKFLLTMLKEARHNAFLISYFTHPYKLKVFDYRVKYKRVRVSKRKRKIVGHYKRWYSRINPTFKAFLLKRHFFLFLIKKMLNFLMCNSNDRNILFSNGLKSSVVFSSYRMEILKRYSDVCRALHLLDGKRLKLQFLLDKCESLSNPNYSLIWSIKSNLKKLLEKKIVLEKGKASLFLAYTTSDMNSSIYFKEKNARTFHGFPSKFILTLFKLMSKKGILSVMRFLKVYSMNYAINPSEDLSKYVVKLLLLVFVLYKTSKDYIKLKTHSVTFRKNNFFRSFFFLLKPFLTFKLKSSLSHNLSRFFKSIFTSICYDKFVYKVIINWIDNDTVSAQMISYYISRRLEQGFTIREAMNPLTRELNRVKKANSVAVIYRKFKSKLRARNNLHAKSIKILLNQFSLLYKELFSLFDKGTFINLNSFSLMLAFRRIFSANDFYRICFLQILNFRLEKFILFFDFNSFLKSDFFFKEIFSVFVGFFFVKTDVLLYKLFDYLYSDIFIVFGYFQDVFNVKNIFLCNVFFDKFFRIGFWQYNLYKASNVNKRRMRLDNLHPGAPSGLLGYKIMCRGRFTRKQIAASYCYMHGRAPLNTLSANIDYGFSTRALFNSLVSIKVYLYRPKVFRDCFIKCSF